MNSKHPSLGGTQADLQGNIIAKLISTHSYTPLLPNTHTCTTIRSSSSTSSTTINTTNTIIDHTLLPHNMVSITPYSLTLNHTGSDHRPVLIILDHPVSKLTSPSPNSSLKPPFNLTKATKEHWATYNNTLQSLILSLHIAQPCTTQDIDSQSESITNCIVNAATLSFPENTSHLHQHTTSAPQATHSQVHKLHTIRRLIASTPHSSPLQRTYKTILNKTTKTIKKAKLDKKRLINHIKTKNLLTVKHHNPKLFWNHFKSITEVSTKSKIHPLIISPEGTSTIDPKIQADTHAQHLKSTMTPLPDITPSSHLPQHNSPSHRDIPAQVHAEVNTWFSHSFTLTAQSKPFTSLNNINLFITNPSSSAGTLDQMADPITPSDVEISLSARVARAIHSSPGHDHISYKLLQNSPPYLIQQLTNLFNASLYLGYIPKSAKTSFITVIPKPHQDHKYPKNYRPLSLTTTIWKILEDHHHFNTIPRHPSSHRVISILTHPTLLVHLQKHLQPPQHSIICPHSPTVIIRKLPLLLSVPASYSKINNLMLSLPNNIIFGDLNLEHTSLGSTHNTKNGILLHRLIVENNNTPLLPNSNTRDAPTTTPFCRTYTTIDHTLLPPSINTTSSTSYTLDHTGSDHRPVLSSLDIPLPNHTPTPHHTSTLPPFDLRKATKEDWKSYHATLHSLTSTIPDTLPSTTKELADLSDTITHHIITAATLSFPATIPRDSKHPTSAPAHASQLISRSHSLQDFQPKEFWKTIKSITEITTTSKIKPLIVSPDGTTSLDPKLQADTHANHLSHIMTPLPIITPLPDTNHSQSPNTNPPFRNIPAQTHKEVEDWFHHIFTPQAQHIPHTHPDNIQSFTTNPSSLSDSLAQTADPVFLTDVELSIKARLLHASHSSPGHDHITYQLLKNAPQHLIKLLANLYNSSLFLGFLPSSAKTSHVTVIPKPHLDHKLPKNYRPLSLTPSIWKILEAILQSRIMHHMEQNHFINTTQFGFRHNHSTTDAVLTMIHNILHNKVSNLHSLGFFADISKAFDKVCIKSLMYKINILKLPRIISRLTYQFLNNRTSFVKHFGSLSEPFHPLAEHNYTGTPIVIPYTTNHRYLGVLLDSRLQFTQHIDHIKREATKRFLIICRLYRYSPDINPHIMLHLYKSYIRPLMDYCAPIFLLSPVTSCYHLEVLQNKILRHFLNLNRNTKLAELRSLARCTSLKDRWNTLTINYILRKSKLDLPISRLILEQIFSPTSRIFHLISTLIHNQVPEELPALRHALNHSS
ncbi:hypothetical protein ACHWQZ_G010507 [Mnemiopsis leidyi]